MVDFGSEHVSGVALGRSRKAAAFFETAGIAGYSEEFKRAKTQLWAKRCRLWTGTTRADTGTVGTVGYVGGFTRVKPRLNAIKRPPMSPYISNWPDKGKFFIRYRVLI